MKILITHYGIKDRTGFNRNYSLARGLAKLGHKVVLLTTQENGFVFPLDKEMRDGVEIRSYPDIVPRIFRHGGFGLLSTFLKVCYVLFNKFDVVQSDTGHRFGSGLPCQMNRLIHGSVYISEWWDFYGRTGIYDHRRFLSRWTIGTFDLLREKKNRLEADGVVVLSEFMHERALRIGVKEENIAIVHGGADVEQIQYLCDSSYKEHFGLPKESITFCFIGINEDEMKDISCFLNVISKNANKNYLNWFSVGEKLSKDMKEKYNITENYFEFGWIDYRKDSKILSCADVFILLRIENQINLAGWPNKLGDYLAAGRPVMTNGSGDIALYMEKFPDAFLKVDLTEKSIETMLDYIVNNRETIQKKNQYCRRIAENSLSWNTKAKELEKFYLRIIAQKVRSVSLKE
jgi:glycosyltransferase involved in cell wall biosynthesis